MQVYVCTTEMVPHKLLVSKMNYESHTPPSSLIIIMLFGNRNKYRRVRASLERKKNTPQKRNWNLIGIRLIDRILSRSVNKLDKIERPKLEHTRIKRME